MSLEFAVSKQEKERIYSKGYKPCFDYAGLVRTFNSLKPREIIILKVPKEADIKAFSRGIRRAFDFRRVKDSHHKHIPEEGVIIISKTIRLEHKVVSID